MRPRKLRRLVVAASAAMVLAGTGAGYTARAETVTLTGTLGVGPRWSTVVDCPCEPVRYTPWISQRSIAKGVEKLDAHLGRQTATVTVTDKVVGFSLGSVVALGFIRDNPQKAETVEWVLMGSPDTPEGRPSKGKGHRGENGLPDGDWSNVTFVVKQFDPVADPLSRFSWLAAVNASLSVHTRGYDNLDLTAPDAVHVDERTGARTLWYRTDVLPILKWRDWFTSDERMAELDAYYRPKIEAAYQRPVDLEPKPQAQEQKTWTSVTSSESRVHAMINPSTTPGKPDVETDTPAISEHGSALSTMSEQRSTRKHDGEATSTPASRNSASDRVDRRESRREARTERRTR